MPSLPADTPLDLRVGDTAEFLVAGLLLFVALVGTVLVLQGRSGRDLAWRALLLLGSAVCIVFEPALASVGGFWYATVGQNLGLPEMWGVSVGLHMVFGYYIFLGVTAVWIIDRVRAGAKAPELWRLYLVIVVLAIALELPILYATDIYTYYGVNQPFFDSDWWPLPLWYPILNATLPFCMATFGLLIVSTGRRWHLWLIPAIMPAYLFAVYFAQAWPVLTMLNSDVSKLVAYFGGAATMALALLMMHFQSLALPRLRKSKP